MSAVIYKFLRDEALGIAEFGPVVFWKHLMQYVVYFKLSEYLFPLHICSTAAGIASVVVVAECVRK